MKAALHTLYIGVLLLCALASHGQTSLTDWQTDSGDNIVVEKLAGDSLTTSFIIEVKKNVPLHYHAHHSEHVYILEGNCMFKLNSDTLALKPGDYVFIPSKSHHEVWVTGSKPLKALSIQAPEFVGKDRIKVGK